MRQLYTAELDIPVGAKASVKGDCTIPEEAKGLVIFSHGSGSSRFSPRNSMVADYLSKQGFATLLFDLLTAQEDSEYLNRFNIRLLAERLIIVSEWLMSFEKTRDLHQAYFGASIGAAVALYAAAAERTEIAAVVSRGGRPDLALEVLPTLQAPALLIVGGDDNDVLQLNIKAFDAMQCSRRLEVIPGATHLFEEKGAMEKVCVHASTWFEQYLHPIRMIPE